MLQRAIAIDFDGCLCDEAYPEIGAPHWDIIAKAKQEHENGTGLILWTCREGKYLQDALDACESWGLHFDAVNESLPSWIEHFGVRSRKVGANEYWDDKAKVIRTADVTGNRKEKMERLTYFDSGKWRLKIGETEYSGDAVDRLAAYENIGLEPDQIRTVLDDAAREFAEYDGMAPKERLCELAQADMEGRCEVLPCKVGDTVWLIVRRGVYRVERWVVYQVYKRDGGSWYFKLKNLMLSQKRPNELEECTRAISSFGKTVFLTREEAQAALQREQYE